MFPLIGMLKLLESHNASLKVKIMCLTFVWSHSGRCICKCTRIRLAFSMAKLPGLRLSVWSWSQWERLLTAKNSKFQNFAARFVRELQLHHRHQDGPDHPEVASGSPAALQWTFKKTYLVAFFVLMQLRQPKNMVEVTKVFLQWVSLCHTQVRRLGTWGVPTSLVTLLAVWHGGGCRTFWVEDLWCWWEYVALCSQNCCLGFLRTLAGLLQADFFGDYWMGTWVLWKLMSQK